MIFSPSATTNLLSDVSEGICGRNEQSKRVRDHSTVWIDDTDGRVILSRHASGLASRFPFMQGQCQGPE
jgi:hypothetical protein